MTQSRFKFMPSANVKKWFKTHFMVTIIYLHDHHLFSILYWFTVFFNIFDFLISWSVSQGALQGVSTTNVRRRAAHTPAKKKRAATARGACQRARFWTCLKCFSMILKYTYTVWDFFTENVFLGGINQKASKVGILRIQHFFSSLVCRTQLQIHIKHTNKQTHK